MLRLIVIAVASVRAVGASVAFDMPDYSKAAPDIPSSTTTWPSANASKSTYIYLHASMPLAKATPYYFGANVPLYIENALLLSDNTTAQMQDAVSFLRYPGGSSANKYLWDGDFDTYPYFSTWSWMASSKHTNMTQFVELINATGAVPLVELNAALALVYGYENASAYFVRQHEALLALGLNVTHYEFGNENYGGWEPPYGDYAINGSLYAAAFEVAASALKASYPYIQLGAVVQWSDSDGVRQGVSKGVRVPRRRTESGRATSERLGTFIANWTADVLTGCGTLADFLIVHEYYTSGSTVPTNDELLAEVALLSNMSDGVAAFMAQYAPSVSVPPLILSEFNIGKIQSGACGATLEFINVLWHARMLGEGVLNDHFKSLVSFSWADGFHNCTYSGHGATGDYGMVSTGNDAVADGTPTAHLYAYALYMLACGDTLVNVTVHQGSSSKISAYGSTFSGGDAGLVVVNSDSAAHTITLATASPPKSAIGWIVGSSDPTADDPLSASGVTWNGETSPQTFPLLEHLGAYSIDAVSHDGSVSFDVPGYSVAGVVLYF